MPKNTSTPGATSWALSIPVKAAVTSKPASPPTEPSVSRVAGAMLPPPGESMSFRRAWPSMLKVTMSPTAAPAAQAENVVAVPPTQFVPLAEQTGLIIPIGWWAMREACAHAARWFPAHGVAVTVNVSAHQLREDGFADGVLEALQDQKIKDLQEKQKVLQAAQEKLDKGAAVMSDQARAQLQMDIERQTRDIQRAVDLDPGAAIPGFVSAGHRELR